MLNGMIMGKKLGKSNNQKKTHGPFSIKNKMVGFQPCSNGASMPSMLLPRLDPYCQYCATAAALDGEKVAIPIPWSWVNMC
jgi:hypothetical protein